MLIERLQRKLNRPLADAAYVWSGTDAGEPGLADCRDALARAERTLAALSQAIDASRAVAQAA
jgi:hypothetical protein